jgi:hypothetical protein
MELGVLDPWKIVKYNNNFAYLVNHKYAQSEMMSHPTKYCHMSSLGRPTIYQ